MSVSLRRRRTIVAGCFLAVVMAGVWLCYSYLYGIPTGPPLPPLRPEPEFSAEVIELNNRATEVHFYDSEEALRLYDAALKADPSYYPGYSNKATLLLQDKRYAEAAQCYETATALQPHEAGLYTGHALCLHRLGKEEQARDRLLYAISACNLRMEKETDPAPGRLERAMVLFLLGRDHVARRELEALTGRSAVYDELVASVHEAMDATEGKDRWSILGLDE